MTFRYFFTLCLLWSTAALLQGCGGGADAKNTLTGDAGVTITPVAVQTGIYASSINGQEFWGVITPSNRWYGLHSPSNGYDIYSGNITYVDAFRASVPTLKYQNNSAKYLAGSGSLSSTGQGKLSGTLVLTADVSIQPVNFINASATHSFTSNATKPLNDIAGTWTGQLSYGLGVTSQMAITIDGNSGMITVPDSFSGCHFNPSTSMASQISNANVFTLTLNTSVTGSSTGCDNKLNNKTFTGVAFVAPSTGSLIGVAADAEGYAIAFKATR